LPKLLDAIIAECPDALLVVAQIIPYNGVDSYNAAIPGIVEQKAQAGAHIIMVDQNTGFPNSELDDGVHPNQAGYERMGKVWYDAIEEYLP
jgi:lysophospholipase L1-like esterase